VNVASEHPDTPVGVPMPKPTPPGGTELIADNVSVTAPALATLNVTTLDPPTPRVPENDDPPEVAVVEVEVEVELELSEVSLSRIPQPTIGAETTARTNAVSRGLLRNASFRFAETCARLGPDRTDNQRRREQATPASVSLIRLTDFGPNYRSVKPGTTSLP
jgi:hypothetical protein